MVTMQNISKMVQIGCIRGNLMDNLLRLMSDVYVPSVLSNKTWPDSVKKEFTGQLHKFMANLTESTYQVKGKTVLYIPQELLGSPRESAQEKDLVQRLESTLIHWTRQIKEVVNNQDNGELGEDAGPLAEIEFWRSRSVDLSGIREQLDEPGVSKIVEVLEAAKSGYLAPFLNLSNLIQREAEAAQNNLRFLSSLEEPCTALASADPEQIPPILPRVLHCIRLIWNVSTHYNTPERLTGLLRKVSNEIINRCCAKIDLKEIFEEGVVESCMQALRESINSGEAWKKVYKTTVEAVRRGTGKSWDAFDESSIFAQIDAFVQRCKDLLEVCEALTQFAPKAKLPTFGGTRGPEITKSLLNIQSSFQKLLAQLRGLNYSILDVKATFWHDDFNSFKSGVKDLEVMMTNVIILAFETVSSLSSRVELLNAFHSMAKRDQIKLCIQKKTSECYIAFTHDLNIVKKQFDQMRRNPPVNPLFPKYVGAAMWTKELMKRMEVPMSILLKSTADLPQTAEANELKNAYHLATAAMEQYIKNQHLDWFNTIDSLLMKKLENNLIQPDEETGLLVMNFDKQILSTFAEVHFFERLHLEIPYIAMELSSQRDKYRILTENVLMVVRDYNNILNSLDAQERKLFADRIRYLEKRIAPGVHKLNWVSTKSHLDYYVREARKYCKEVENLVLDYKAANERIHSSCQTISETQLVNITKKRVYMISEFQEVQRAHRDTIKAKFSSLVKDIKDVMSTTYETFANDSDDVQEEWMKYTEKVDKKMSDALKQTVKKSLQELLRALNGDAKTEVTPVFSVVLGLETSSNVELNPSIQAILSMINTESRDLITVIQIVPRISQVPSTDASSDQEEELPSFYDIISNDEDSTLKTITTITIGARGIVEKLQQFLTYWDKKYRHIWDQDKDAYIRRYERAKKPLSAFDSDIMRYKELQEAVVGEETSTNMRFLRIDCGPLKHSLITHCEAWVFKFTGLLNSLAHQELRKIHDIFISNTELLNREVRDLDQLAESVTLLQKMVEGRGSIEASFEPLHEKYRTLEKFEIQVTEEETALLDTMQRQWTTFQQFLAEKEIELDRTKESFREKLARMVDTFIKEVADGQVDFSEGAPNEFEIGVEQAFLGIEQGKAITEGFRKKEAELKPGMDIFGMPQPPLKELVAMEKELGNLTNIWTLVKEWYEAYNSWKDGKFKDLEIEAMEETAGRFSKRVTKLGRELKNIPVWRSIKEIVDSFKKTMPLIVDLRNPAMRPRHWKDLMAAADTHFDPAGDTFTLASVIDMRLDQFSELIGEMSTNASKELAIEQSLKAIEETWQQLDLDMVLYKDSKDIYKLRSTEDIFLALEDNIVTLSTTKASKYYMVFEKDINTWEQSLSHLSETVEMVIQVQRNWMYLENIFVGSEDIRKQLPQESIMFEKVHLTFIQKMKKLADVKNALRATTSDGMLDSFMDMDLTLEKIQKSLENYLEAKRQQFPRFYFISSDDLLEILGQAKDPLNVQPHLKKCFEGIKKLEIHHPGTEGRRHHEASQIISPDGEILPLLQPTLTEGRPEEWLNDVEAAMYAATKKQLFKTLEDSKGMKKEKWVKEFQGQCVISAGQIIWTAECERALSEADSSKSALRQLKKKWLSYLNKLTAVTRSKLGKVDRKKVVALITIEVHARDVIEKLAKTGCNSSADFEWVSQLRFYWDKELNDCVVKQVLSVFTYGYEYQGNNGRLVITPLTDRCYMTLGAALFTRRGGNPLGPAGTGKTETVKDFGKALARYVIVFNCSDGVDYKMTGKMFSGLAQTGAWTCLDEFNRIEVEVLSVVASQISTVMAAIKAGKTTFSFIGHEIRLISTIGIFVTMNPGYAGRSELPDNLKAIVRPVSMMVPDFTLIAEIMMFSEGFQTAKALSKKMIAIMELSQQQLSKQDHYDYGLRSFVIPIARAAGSLKRVDQDVSEEVIMFRTMKDLIAPKLVFHDLPLFNALLNDLFPGVELPPQDGGILKAALEAELRENNLQVINDFVLKIIQIFDCKVARHGNMIVGNTGAGKSEAWKCLIRAMARLRKEGHDDEQFQKVSVHTINPLSLSNDEMYGNFDPSTHEWSDGILARIMRTVCKDESPDQKWILFDGPVDTLWIESMNTTLDDNKLLTLLSGERISMPAQVSLLFEVEDLSQASPATVSRAGMIYLSTEDLGWRPFVKSWLTAKANEGSDKQLVVDILQKSVDKYVDAALEYRRKECKELIPTDPLTSVRSLTYLYDSLEKNNEMNLTSMEGGVEQFTTVIEYMFNFSLIWALGGSLDEDSRKKFDVFLRELDSRYPSQETVFDYWLDTKKKSWALWEEKLSSVFKVPSDVPFYKIMVPTVDTIRTAFIARSYVNVQRHSIIVGRVGVGKSMVATSLLSSLPDAFNNMVVNFSAQTSSNSLQNTIEGKLEKRTKGVFAPPGGKKLLCFIDDFNMPQKSKFGFIPPLELLKLWADYGFWYDRSKQEVKHIKDMQLIAAMAPPGGGRNNFSQRILACFNLVNMTMPNNAQLKRVFSTLINARLSDFDDEIKPLGDVLTQASIVLYRNAVEELLPTPSKMHYIFNTRDLAKVVQGLLQATKAFYDSKESMLQLWCHETFRIYGDRMWDSNDKEWLTRQLNEILGSLFSTSYSALFESGEMMPFVNFMRPEASPPPYEPVMELSTLKTFLTEKLEDYNLEPGKSAMDLVLFKDALHHVCRIHRILMQPRGNCLLVGVGGSGRKSLVRLASYVAEYHCFSVEITKNYRSIEFHEDLKLLYQQAGVQNKPTVFLFDDTQIVYETFLEDINNILTSGEVPNLFSKEDLQAIVEELRPIAKKEGKGETAGELYAFFLERVISNLHVALCLSPIGDTFRERCRMFPGLVNCTTIDWFTAWPADALYEVAMKQLEEDNLGSDEVKSNVCKVFVTAHQSVSDMSAEMLQKLKRHNYVTPTNYLEFVGGYKSLLAEKRHQIGDKAQKLRGGLLKLDETGEQVQEMQAVCQDKKIVVAKAKRDCEDLLVEIVQDKRVADEQEKQVNAEAQKIGKEEEDARAIAAECQAGLDKAMPALEEAEAALNVLTKKDMSELKAYTKPPPAVEMVLGGVMVVLKKGTSWDAAKKELGASDFLSNLISFDKDKLDDALLKKISKYTNMADFQPDIVGKVSNAAKGLCLWVCAMETYGHVSKEVAPKRAKLKGAQDLLRKKQKALSIAKEKLDDVLGKVQALKDKYEESTSNKVSLEQELDTLEMKLQRAEKLVTGLAGERNRWESSIAVYEQQISDLPGDCVIAAGFMSYAGPFPSEYRDALVKDTWLKQVKELVIPSSPDFDFASFLADPSDVRDWNIQGLPADSFSTENGVLVTRGRRWPLMVDPQGQANKWIKSMEGGNQLMILDQHMGDMVRRMENAIQFGNPVLLQDVLEEIDPVLEPVLGKATIKRGNQVLMKLGDKEIDYSPDFRLYVTTKLSNPHYTPEVSTKVTICNFAVKEQGLEAQLLNFVVQKERPDLDKQKNELVVKVAQGKRTQAELEDQILYMLSTATGSLLDNVELINTLDKSKTTWEEVNESLKVAEETSEKIQIASDAYRPCSIRASVLYFVLNDLAQIDPMYQFSLDAYTELFFNSIIRSQRNDNVLERIKILNDYHTYSVYKYTSRGLFERHKLLLSLQMCVRILQTSNQINNEEWQYFLRGGTVLDKKQQPPNPAPSWLSEESWDNITELENLPHFKGIVSSFEQNIGNWEEWYRSNAPEVSSAAELPGEWESKCNELQRMIFVRCLRSDRVVFAATAYVEHSMGRKYVEPPVLDLNESVMDSTTSSPLIFVLSPGVDPTYNLQQLAASKGLQNKLFTIALGQGQAPLATKMIEDGIREGNWVFLANCHLMTSWLPTLDKIVETFPSKQPHENFRLWLSSNPTSAFPIAILQRSIKMTTEPPKGLRANMLRLYNTITDESFNQCKATHKYPKLLFALVFFHSVLLERRKFRNLGLNIPYDFNDTDFQVSDDLLKTYLDEYDETPWDALKYLISEANYGGRVTDELDRRVLNSYLNQYYCEEALEVSNFQLSTIPNAYVIPDNGRLQSYRDYIQTLSSSDEPEAFGQHPNADISFQIEDTKVILNSIIMMQPQIASTGGTKREDVVYGITADLLAQIPEPFDLEALMKSKADDPSALHVVLFQEVERYNVLLRLLRKSCMMVQKGIKGLVVMSQDLDEIFNALADAKVPQAWLKAYPSLKALGPWTRDLLQRTSELSRWINDGYPTVYWLSGFTYPTGFLTAVLQTTARKHSIPIDSLSWDFSIITSDEAEITQPPKDGVFVKGMFLEGAGWDFENGCLMEPDPMELIVPMPIIHFKPTEVKKKGVKGIYGCPCYSYPIRTGSRERPSFMIMVELRSGNVDQDHWVKRGTALLLSLGT